MDDTLQTPLNSTFEQDIATAPGDLPMPAVLSRFRALEWQFRHDNTIDPLAPRPGQPVRVTATAGRDVHLERAAVFYSTDGSRPDIRSASVFMEPDGVEWNPLPGLLTCWRAEVPGQPAGTIVRYRLAGWRLGAPGPADREPDIWANDGQGFWFQRPGPDGITTFAYVVEPPRAPLPEWLGDAVVYHIFLDRFHPGTPNGAFPNDRGPGERHGGTLAGVRQALPYLVDLGVTCLWLSPLGPSESYHRYDTMDYFGVDPELGTVDELRALIQEAHGLGVRIWLDFVPSHASWHHPAFVAAQQDRSAPTYSWFTFDDWPNGYRSFLQRSPTLPSVNTDDPAARAHLIEAAAFWLREVGVDGFRIDHAIGPGMDFWVALRIAAQRARGDVSLVGEVTDTLDCLRRYRGKLHGVLDFPLARALRLCFGTDTWNLAQLDGFLAAYERFMADGPGRVSFLDNHDMDRFLYVAGNDTRRLKMAAVCQFMLDATPVVYYGTEIGMTQEHGGAELGFGGDAEARRDMPWEESRWDQHLLAFYRALIRLRRDEATLRRGARQTVHLDLATHTYAYVRRPSDPTRPASALLTAFNTSEEAHEIRLVPHEVSGAPACLLTTGADAHASALSNGIAIMLPAMTAAIFRLGKSPPATSHAC